MKSAKNIILFIASTGVFFEALDIAIVNLAMPLIQQDFGLANDEVQWVQTLYIVLYGGFLIAGGRLSDTIGRRRTFLIGNALFLLTSLGAALSFRFDMLVAFRAVQGIGAALMMPSALSIITNTFTDSQERARAIGIFGAFAAVGSGSGMSIGGLIASGFGWQSVFLINIPVISATMLLAYRYIEPEPPANLRWSQLFQGFLPASLFRIPDVLLGGAVMMLLGGVFTGFLFVISMLLQNNMQYSAAQAGLLIFPFSLLSALSSRTIVPPLMRRLPVDRGAVVGMVLMVAGCGMVLASMTLDHHLLPLLLALACVIGVGMSICFTTLTVLSVQSVPVHQHGITNGLCTTAYFFGGGAGLVALSLVMDTTRSNIITPAPVIVLTAIAASGVLCLLYFGGSTSARPLR